MGGTRDYVEVNGDEDEPALQGEGDGEGEGETEREREMALATDRLFNTEVRCAAPLLLQIRLLVGTSG